MTDHDPDAQIGCYIYLGGIGLGLAIFALGVWIGTML